MGIIIKNGLIVDGTGKEGYNADVYIEDDLIKEIGRDLQVEGAKEIDATGLIVSPGFIDIHHHGDLNLINVNKVEPAIMQGVTTIVVGNCGLGLAPANDKVRKYYSDYASLAFGGSTDLYDTLEDYFNDIREKGVSSNLAFFIPHGNIRAFVLGIKEGEPTQPQLDKMKELIKEGMKSGAFGMSTGLVYPPGSESSTEELIELSKVVNNYGGIYMSHIRNEGSHIIDIGMEEVFRIANETNIPVQVSHWSVISKYAQNLTEEVINLVKKKQEEGMEINVDVIPYDDGFTSLSFILLPTWVYENFNENLRDPAKRKKVIDAIFNKLYSMFFADAPFYIRLIPKFILKKLIFTSLAKIVRVLDADKYKNYIGKTLQETLDEIYPDKNIYDSLLDFMKDENGRVVIQIKHKDEDINVIPMFVLDFACVSSDGLLVVDGNAHPMSHGAFVRVLERYVREKNLITLEDAVRKMSSLPASILGINNRGIIKEGYKADLVIFNLDEVKEKGTLENGCQFPEGINYVLVNGKITAADGVHKGTLNGKILINNK